jgi:hypothetical protein
MKFCIISYDYFGFDKHILTELQKRNLSATHIDMSKFHFSYSCKFQKFYNFFLKLFVKKNIKQIELKKYIFKQLVPLGKLDVILVIRPDLINRATHLEIKKHTSEYVCFLYDSCLRFDIKNLKKGIFERIYSYDLNDVEKFGFIHLTNYIYLQKVKIKKSFKNKVFLIMSVDDRLIVLNLIMKKLSTLGVVCKCIVVSPQRPQSIHPNIEYSKENKTQAEVQDLMNESEIFLDLSRNNHNGLSFRVFEALAFQRKLITTNQSIKKYPFYNPDNILIIDEKQINFRPEFFNTPYTVIPKNLYNNYTLHHWIETVFDLQKT